MCFTSVEFKIILFDLCITRKSVHFSLRRSVILKIKTKTKLNLYNMNRYLEKKYKIEILV